MTLQASVSPPSGPAAARPEFHPVREVGSSGLTPQFFHEQIVERGEPVVLRGLVANWPLVRAGLRSDEELAAYLSRFDRRKPMRAMIAPSSAGGRFFYNSEGSGFNFRTESLKLQAALDLLISSGGDPKAPSLAIQSIQVWENLPGLDRENPLPLLPDSVEPRIWIGNRVTVAAHHDPSENIACVAAGRRRFTLFPPDQVANLYPGPFELTPAGPIISMVDFDDPDRAAYPDFAKAEAAALCADLEPGDAIYIPYLWWHHVRSTEAVNMLVNYWWSPLSWAVGFPLEAMLHAMIAIRALPKKQRNAWAAMFEHFVFGGQGAGAHLPDARRGIQGCPPDASAIERVRAALAQSLARK